MVIYNKLVRDKIPMILKKKGLSHSYHIATNDEYWTNLKQKLDEEVSEFKKSESFEEIADLLEVIDAICIYKDINKQQLKHIKNKKAKIKGKFKDKIILEEVKE